MRLFVAVRLAEQVLSAAETVAADLRLRIDPRVRASWIAPAKMHLTVRFIGDVDASRAPAVVEALAPPLPIEPFEIALNGCGAFPRSGPPRVFWIGLSAGLEGLQRMHDEFNRRLDPLGFAPEDRPFNAHLTLARIKDAPRGAAQAARDILTSIVVPRVHSRVDYATAFHSSLSPKGSTYHALLQIPLSA